METFLHSATSVGTILLLALTGYFCAWRGWLKKEAKEFLSKFLIRIAVPCMCIYGLTNNLTKEMLRESGTLLLAAILCIGTNYVLAAIIGKCMKLPRKTWGVFVLGCAMSNAMFIGYPMCVELFGEGCIPQVLVFYLVSTTGSQVVGFSLVQWAGQSGDAQTQMWKRIVKSPSVLAIGSALAIVLLEVELPSFLTQYAYYMNGTVSALALLLAGYTIYDIGLKNLRLDRKVATILIFRFLFAPLLMFLICSALGVNELSRNVFIIESAMPVVTISVVAAAEFGADEGLAAQSVAISTVACFFVIPFLMLIVS